MAGRIWRLAVSVFFALLVLSRPLVAQVDLSGEWNSLLHKDIGFRFDNPDPTAAAAAGIRGAGGPHIGDYSGLPINPAARLRADSWDPRINSVAEHQEVPSAAAPWWVFQGGGMRISKITDPENEKVVGWKIYRITVAGGAESRSIWTDGRPRPPAYALHTWSGFSTGSWEGDMLTVETTHLKASRIRRNGVPASDQATVRQHLVRHGSVLTIINVVSDPIYLEEPYIASASWVLDSRQQLPDPFPTRVVEEIPGQPHVRVPHFLPGTNPFLHEYADQVGVPADALRGGKETMYPEYQMIVRDLMIKSSAPDSSATPSHEKLESKR